MVTLYRDKHGRYQEKAYQLVVKQAATGKPLATFKLDASHFATASGTKETTELRTQNPKEDGLVKVSKQHKREGGGGPTEGGREGGTGYLTH